MISNSARARRFVFNCLIQKKNEIEKINTPLDFIANLEGIINEFGIYLKQRRPNDYEKMLEFLDGQGLKDLKERYGIKKWFGLQSLDNAVYEVFRLNFRRVEFESFDKIKLVSLIYSESNLNISLILWYLSFCYFCFKTYYMNSMYVVYRLSCFAYCFLYCIFPAFFRYSY